MKSVLRLSALSLLLIIVALLRAVPSVEAMAHADNTASSIQVNEMASRYLAAIDTGDAAAVTAFLSLKAKRDFRKITSFAAPFAEKSAEREVRRKAIFGTANINSLSDSEFVLDALRALLRPSPDAVSFKVTVLGGVRDGDERDYVVCKREEGSYAETFLLEATREGGEIGFSLEDRLAKLAHEIADQV